MAKATPTQPETTGLALQSVTAAELGLEIAKAKPVVLRQTLIGYLAGQRQSPAHTKTRGEVSGGGRKPWRQKGTGRARVGSSRTPLWRGGGVIFGPTNIRNFKKTIPARDRRQALTTALLVKAEADAIKTLTLPQLDKTKAIKAQLPDIYTGRRVLLITPQPAQLRAWRNLPNLRLVSPRVVNALEVMMAKTIIVTQDALPILRERLT